jgi:hypothetical protein
MELRGTSGVSKCGSSSSGSRIAMLNLLGM